MTSGTRRIGFPLAGRLLASRLLAGRLLAGFVLAGSIFASGLLVATGAIAADKEQREELAAQARGVLRTHCHRCHNGPGSEGGNLDYLDVAALTKAQLIQPGAPDRSRLMQRVAKAEMPPKPDRLYVEEAEVIRRWIAAGAPAFPMAEAARQQVGLEAVLTAVRDHLRQAPSDDRPYLRFFTLHNLANDPRTSLDDLRSSRAALSKVLNSLSWNPKIHVPRAIDEAQVVFAIDLRDYDWDRTDVWQKIMRAYPYGLKYRNHPQRALQSLDAELEELTGCMLPWIRADWFIATATRPPLYHRILDLPGTARELEERLKVDIAGSFRDPRPDRIARAGFHKSGVSGQNRLVERHRSAYGYYWKSYDFKPDSPRTRLTRFPLGPLNLFPANEHPFASQAFIHDGGEIIFTLPNRLQGYMLIDGQDQRIDEGPIQVVSDALKTSGTNSIFNGVSCMACHKHGVIGFQDVLRDGHAVFGDAQRAVEKLFPPQKEMDQLLAQDERDFLAALEATIGPFVKVAENQQLDIKDFAEPVGEIARRYRLGFLDLRTVALEIDLQQPEELKKKVGEKTFKQLGLEALLRTGGVISRLEWESSSEQRDGISLMQELARELGFDIVK